MHPARPVTSSARTVLSIFQRSQQFLAVAGPVAAAAAGLSLLAAPAFATERPGPWALNDPAAQRVTVPQVATLPPLPAVPRTFALTPERRALLNTIRFAEGTWANGHEVGYRILFGGGQFHSFDRHPDRVIYSSRYASAAAGAYQFMPFTWAMVSRAMGLNGFHPEAQDQAAVFLIQRRGALPLADRGEMTPELAALLSPEWASFPTLAGNSYYGQPVKRFEDLRRFYEGELARLRSGDDQWENVAIRPAAPPCREDTLECRLQSIRQSPVRPVSSRY